MATRRRGVTILKLKNKNLIFRENIIQRKNENLIFRDNIILIKARPGVLRVRC